MIVLGSLVVACSSGGGGKGDQDADGGGGWDFQAGKDTTDTQDLADAQALDTPPPMDTVPEVNDEGILAYCTHDDNCLPFGLKCYKDGPGDLDPICSRDCSNNGECPEGSICKLKGGAMVCARAVYCDPCANDGECGPGKKCIKDYKGVNYCSPPCDYLDQDSCALGSLCLKAADGTFCRPLFGACRENGAQCAQCTLDRDCQDGLACHLNETTGERYCAKVCQTKQECPVNFGCHRLQGETRDLCTMELDGEISETCKSGTKDFCYPCQADAECHTEVCYQSEVDSPAYGCAVACDPDNSNCSSGLFCVKNRGKSSAEYVCMPAPKWFCQGFLNCEGVKCKTGEVCDRGFCKPK
jgi:hypothetical protein